ncbi:cytochrome P450 [Sphaerisporangium sp. B11E5]|uniref:cytochrome P450 n=1 Tax=Sphaerisporangium sp. B11E5 TaxID=3153563 RepID=UPI00325E3369
MTTTGPGHPPAPACAWPDLPPGPFATPSPDLARRHAEAPLEEVTLPSRERAPMLVRHADVRAMLSAPACSRDLRAPGLVRMVDGASLEEIPDVLFNMDAPEHTRLRAIVRAVFTPRQAEHWRPVAAGLARELLGTLGERFDVVEDYAAPLSIGVICAFLGVPESDRGRFSGWANTLTSASGASAGVRVAALEEFTAYTADLVARHRARPGDDLIDALVRARDEHDRLSENELVTMVWTIILTGHETVAMMIARAAHRLLLHPGQYARLAADPGLVPAAVEEVLRFDGPGSNGLLRLTRGDVALPSGTVPAGTVVLPNLSAANHDPHAYPEPDRFDAGRFRDPGVTPHLGFGHGPHYCLGASLARMELQEALGALVALRPTLLPAVPLEEVEWTTDTLFYQPLRLPVRSA